MMVESVEQGKQESTEITDSTSTCLLFLAMSLKPCILGIQAMQWWLWVTFPKDYTACGAQKFVA